MVQGVFSVPWVVVAQAGAPYKTLQGMIDASKKAPEGLSWGYGASSLQLGAEYFKFTTGAKLIGVQYKGTAPALTDLLGGHVPLNITTVAATLPHIKAGRISALATMGLKRLPQLAEVPTVHESGYPGFAAEGWGGMVVPKATPTAVVARISEDVQALSNDTTLLARMRDRGVVPDFRSAEEWTKFVHAEIVKWKDVAQRANVKVD